jgi:hypothetical protein
MIRGSLALVAALLFLVPTLHAAKRPRLKPAPQAAESHPSEAANRVSIGIDRIDQRGPNIDRQYFYERTGMGVTAYVVDTGVNFNNNDFGGRVIPLFDFQRLPSDPSFGVPNDEHGTDVASQIGGRTFGVAKNVTIYSVRVKDFITGAGTTQDLINGLEAIRQHLTPADGSGQRRPAVVNMSILQTGCPSTACNNVENKVQELVNAGAVVVVGTNNQAASSSSFAPSRRAIQSTANGMICVGGTEAIDFGDSFDDTGYFNSGFPVEIHAPAGHDGAPGVAWYQHALSHDSVYGKGGFLNGNSMAAPLVTGAVALYMENFSGQSNDQHPGAGTVEQAILNNGSPIPSGTMVYTGCEFLSPYAENPLLDNRRFVKQQYLDFLGRQPDAGGWEFWIGNITNDTNCAVDRWGCNGRVNTSQAFFESIENKETTFFAYRVHRLTFSSFPKPEDGSGFSTRANPRMERLFADGRKIGRGVVVGAPGWESLLNANQHAFCDAWVQTAEFLNLYPPGMSNTQLVQAWYDNAQVPLDSLGQTAISRLDNGEGRGPVLFDVIKGDAFSSSDHIARPDTVRNLWNPMYVLLCYMGYLRRNPDDAPNFNDLGGYNFWLNKINQQTFVDNDPFLAHHEMIHAFILAAEYAERFFNGPHCGEPPPPPPPDPPCCGEWW